MTNESVYGTLHVKRILRRSGSVLTDLIMPRYYKQPSAYVIRDAGGPEEVLVGLRGKVLNTLTPDDDGRQVCVTGVFRWNPRVGPKRRLGAVTRATLRFLGPGDNPEAQ